MKWVKIASEQLKEDVIAELERIRDNLRLKGDYIRASKVEKFKQEYFVATPSDADKIEFENVTWEYDDSRKMFRKRK